MILKAATVQFDDTNTPVSSQFGDFYFNTDSGLQEADYVFIKSNDLPERWIHEPEQARFVIGETGFGTGLNFLLSWQHFRQFRKDHEHAPLKQLHFISFEKYPLNTVDIEQSLASWPQLAELSTTLIKQYPPLLPGCHRMVFDNGNVVLDLWMGDIKDTLPRLFHGKSGFVDAWYLDGFAPSKNADMWCPEVFQSIATLAKPDSTIATFTSARIVRDGLEAVGYQIKKIPGFGKKREMITAVLADKTPPSLLPPFYFRHANNNSKKQVAIIGGGIAAAQMAFALAKRGYDITLFCKDSALAQGASQNRQGALYPLLHASHDSLSEFYAQAYMFAVAQYRQLLAEGFDYQHQFCGVLLQAFNDKTKQRQQSLIDSQLWPQHLFRAVDAEQSSEIANLNLPHDGLFFPNGGWINPGSLIDALLKAARQLSTVRVKLNQPVDALNQDEDLQWQLSINNELSHKLANVVICCGHLANRFEQTKNLPLSPIRGQVSHLDSIEDTAKLSTVLCYNGYLTPALNDQHCIGASFIKDDNETVLREREHVKNLERLKNGVGEQPWFDDLSVPDQGRASIRCASIDHLPLAGAVPDFVQYQKTYQDLWKGLRPHRYDLPPDHKNLFTLTALGARGLCSAPLGAEIVAAQINNEPYPASQRVLQALNPGRGYVKKLKTRFKS